jgi:hypothetical protein
MKKLSLVLLSMLCADVALAEPPAAALVDKQLVQPLKKAEARRSKFSRAAPPPKARRVRVLDTIAVSDVNGKQFVRFSVDVRHRYSEDGQWTRGAFLGCVYIDEKKVFVEQGSDYVPASGVLNGDGEPQDDVCRPAPEDAAQMAVAPKA